MSDVVFDIVFIGSGPGGYVGAVRAAQLGLKTAVIEKDKTFGGTCLNVGCIPSKALLESSEHYANLNHGLETHGIKFSGLELDLKSMQARKEKIVKDLTQGISFLFKKNKVEVFKGFGKIISKDKADLTQIEVTGDAGEKTIVTAKKVIIATGSVPVTLPFLKVDEKNIVTSTGALALDEVPKKLLVIGGGVIGLELGSVWMRLGAEVTVIEFADRLCPSMDKQTMTLLQRSLTKQGMKFMFSTKVTASKVSGSEVSGSEVSGNKDSNKGGKKSVTLKYENMKDNSTGEITGDVVLVSTGRKPFTDGLGLENVGINKDQRGFIQIDSHWATNVAGIYAIGDVVPGPMLAHKAEDEGVAVAEQLAGQAGHVNYHTVPGVIYTFPEVASVGYSEEQLQEKGIPYRAGSFPFIANGRAKALGTTEGQVKILAHAESDKILGGHIVGPRASELLGEIVVAMEFGGSSEDLARSFHAHPTLNEVVREAALAVDKRARQM